MPKKLDFDPGAENTRPPKRLSLPTETLEEPLSTGRAPRTINPIQTQATHPRAERPRTLTDYLVDKALSQSPDIDPARVRGRIDMLLAASGDILIQWGDTNLAPLQHASRIQADISNEMQGIGATECLNDAKEAICGNKGLLGRLSSRKPEYYEFRLNDAKRALTALMVKTQQQHRAFYPEVHDLHLDGISLAVVSSEYTDAVLMNIANSRTKTLLLAHQTGTMLLTVLENTVQQCVQSIEQIDSLLSVTIPQWKLSIQKQ